MEKGSKNKAKKKKSRLKEEIKSAAVETEKAYKKRKWLQDTATRSNRQDKRRAWMDAELS